MKQGQLIGFANTFYTLWDYQTETTYVTDSYGNHHASGSVTHYYFRKNVSTDLDKVKRLYPDLSIDDSLRGRNSSWDSVGRIELPSDIFWFGKYYGRKVDEILASDMGYCEWVVDKNSCRQSEYIMTHPLYIEHIAKIKAEKDAMIEKSNTLSIGDEVELEFITNGFLNERCDFDDNHQIVNQYIVCIAKARRDDSDCVFYVELSDYKEVGGRFPYIMPNINGKCQKTKGKRFMVKVFEANEPQIDRWNNIQQSIKIA